jgi:hypothetical protein
VLLRVRHEVSWYKEILQAMVLLLLLLHVPWVAIRSRVPNMLLHAKPALLLVVLLLQVAHVHSITASRVVLRQAGVHDWCCCSARRTDPVVVVVSKLLVLHAVRSMLCRHRLADNTARHSSCSRSLGQRCRHLWDAVCQPLLLHETGDVALVHLQAVLQLPLGLQRHEANSKKEHHHQRGQAPQHVEAGSGVMAGW